MSGPAAEIDPVEVADDVDGLAAIVGELVRDNLVDPGRSGLITGPSWTVTIEVADAESRFSLHVGGGRVRVTPAAPQAALTVTTDGETLMDIPETPLFNGLPDLRTAAGRGLVEKIGRRQLRIGGLTRHPLLLRRLLRILTTA